MHHTITPYYITIVDSKGGVRLRDNSFVPVSHRILVEPQDIHGWQSLTKAFNGDRATLIRFISFTMERPSGSLDRFFWEHK